MANRGRVGKLPRGWVAGGRDAAPPGGRQAPRPPGVTVARDADGVPVMVNGLRNPTGAGRYCPPRICYCGRCPWWTPPPGIDYTSAITRLAKLAAPVYVEEIS